MVVGVEDDPARRREFGRRVQIPGPAFQDDRARDGALQRAAHFRPVDRRAGMQDRAVFETFDRVAGDGHVDQDRVGREHAFDRARVCRLDGGGDVTFRHAPSLSRRSIIRRLPPAGGLQSTCTASTPCPWSVRANCASPILITATGPSSRSWIGSLAVFHGRNFLRVSPALVYRLDGDG